MKMNLTPAQTTLYVGLPELERLQELADLNRSAFDDSFTLTTGLSLKKTGAATYTGDWLPSYSYPLIVTIQAGKAILRDSNSVLRAVLSSTPLSIVVPSSSGTYNVFLQYSTSALEAGNVAVNNGSPAIVGTATAFTKYFKPNRQIIIGGVAYTILSVTDDLNLTLTSNYLGTTSGLATFSVGGYFGTLPVSVSDRQIYQFDALQLVVVNNASQPNPIADQQLWLAQVTVSGSAITGLVDKRGLTVFNVNGVLQFWNDGTIDATAGLVRKLTSVSTIGAYNVLTSDCFIEVDVTANPYIQLPAAATMEGRNVTIIKTDSTTNELDIYGNGSEAINGVGGGLPYKIKLQYDFVSLFSDGVGWHTIGEAILVDGVTVTLNSNKQLTIIPQSVSTYPIHNIVYGGGGTTTYNVQLTDYLVKAVLTGTGSFAFSQLPAAASCLGKVFIFKLSIASGAIGMTILTSGLDSIDGGSGGGNYPMVVNLGMVALMANGTNWEIIGKI